MENNSIKTSNKTLMERARESLAGKWGIAIGAAAIYMAISTVVGGMKGIGQLLSLLASGPLALGLCIFSVSISRGKEVKINQLFEGFRRFSTALAAYLIVMLFTILWTLLFIVPGIIAALSYSQTFYILADDQAIGAGDAIKKSKKMMDGYKWKYFCLCFRFIGWGLLSMLTLGIGFLWLMPYMQVSMAKFYDDIKG